MKYLFSSSLIFIAAFFATTSLAQSFQTYKVASYPSGNERCEEIARILGIHFFEKTGKNVFQTTCDRQSSYGYDITLTYISAQPLQVVSTYKEPGGLGYQGIYASMTECENNLFHETERFEEATGLSAFVNYCYRETSITETPFAVRIDALGMPLLYPYRYEHSLFGAILSSPERDVLDEIVGAAESVGIVEPIVAISDDASEKVVVRFFDAPENSVHRHRYFKVEEMGKYYSHSTGGTQQSCLEQLDSAEQFFSFSNPAVWFCVWDDMTFQARLYVFRVKPQEEIHFEEPPLTYDTFTACNLASNELVAYYREQLGKDALGALCYWDDGFWGGQRDTYKMKIFLNE